MIKSTHISCIYVYLFLYTQLVSTQSLDELIQAGRCEPFDQQPLGCQGILVDSWSSVWTAPSYGFTQEYFHALMNTPQNMSYPPIDIPNSLPIDCAVQYLKLICPTYFRPCSTVSNLSLLPYSAVPHFVCRSVCEEFNFVCGAPFNCSQIDPMTGLPLYPSDFDTSCTRLENNALAPIVFNCPPPMKFAGSTTPISGLACDFPCDVSLTLAWNLRDETTPMYITYTVLGCTSFFLTCVTLFLYITHRRFWRWPSRLIIFAGYGIFWYHIGALGNPYYSNSELQCDDEWNLETHSWCKFSYWTQTYGAMQTACWWVIQAIVIFWTVGIDGDGRKLQRFEPLMHLFCWSYPLIVACIMSFVSIDGTTPGGTIGGVPFCASPIEVVELLYGLIIAPILLFMLIVVFCLIFSICRVTFYSNRTRFKNLGNILLFGFLYLNVACSFMAIIFWWQDYHGDFGTSIFNFTVCLLTTLGNLEACQVIQQADLGLTWYYMMSFATLGIGYAIIFIGLYVQIYMRERYIIDPDRLISRSEKKNKTHTSSLDR